MGSVTTFEQKRVENIDNRNRNPLPKISLLRTVQTTHPRCRGYNTKLRGLDEKLTIPFRDIPLAQLFSQSP